VNDGQASIRFGKAYQRSQLQELLDVRGSSCALFLEEATRLCCNSAAPNRAIGPVS
jgi:hypothetical protein